MIGCSEVTIKMDEHGIAADVVCIYMYLKWPIFIRYLVANLPFSLPDSSNVFFPGHRIRIMQEHDFAISVAKNCQIYMKIDY